MHLRLNPLVMLCLTLGCWEANPRYFADSGATDGGGTSGAATTSSAVSSGQPNDTGSTTAASAGQTSDGVTTATTVGGDPTGMATSQGEQTTGTGGESLGCGQDDGNLCHEELTFVAAGDPSSLDLADFDDDGDLDIVVAQEEADAVQLFRNVGTGFFTPEPSVSIPGARPTAICFADLDAQAPLEVVTADRDGKSISVLVADQTGALVFDEAHDTGTRTEDCAVGDFDGDGNIDVFAALRDNDAIGVLLGDGGGALDSPLEFDAPGEPETLWAADINGDSWIDVAAAHNGGKGVSYQINDTDSEMSGPTYDAGTEHFGTRLADLDGDGTIDLVASRPKEGTVSIYWDVMSGLGGTVTTESVGALPGHLATGDLSGDGRLDIVVAVREDNEVVVAVGLGDRTFALVVVDLDGSPRDIAVGDFNGDGVDDFAVTVPDQGEVVVFRSSLGG